jgi:2,3,4,5-tetrahydropyridine-2,6-dicarboxylate N-succinyltransferase
LFKDITPNARYTAINLGIGGVLEPLQAGPILIEDNGFIGARFEIVEEKSLVSMCMFIGQSTKLYNCETGEVIYGRVPAGSVVVSGNLPSADGKCRLYCAVIVNAWIPGPGRRPHRRTAPRRLIGPPASEGGLGPSDPPGSSAGC